MTVEPYSIKISGRSTAVAIFADAHRLAAAVKALHAAGYSPERLSLMGKDTGLMNEVALEGGVRYGETAESLDDLAEASRVDGADEFAGMAIGGTVGFVLGLTAIAIPGFGAFLLAAGPLAIAFNALTTSCAGIGLGALWGAIFDEKVTEDHRDLYRRKLDSGNWLLIVHGSEDEVNRAGQLLQGMQAESVDCF